MADAATAESRRELVRQAFFLEYVTLAWMAIEAAVAIGAGVAAHSLTRETEMAQEEVSEVDGPARASPSQRQPYSS